MTPAQDKESSADYNRRITALAADRAVHRAFQWFHLHEPQLRRWQLELLAIPAPPFAESTRAAWFLSRLGEALPELLVEQAGQQCPGHKVIWI